MIAGDIPELRGNAVRVWGCSQHRAWNPGPGAKGFGVWGLGFRVLNLGLRV